MEPVHPQCVECLGDFQRLFYTKLIIGKETNNILAGNITVKPADLILTFNMPSSFKNYDLILINFQSSFPIKNINKDEI